MLGRAGLITAVPACALVAAVAHAALPSDPLTQNAMFEAVGLPRAWDVTTGAQDVVIAVVDSGVDASHPDLAGAADEGYDFVDGDSGAAPLVAGIAALLRAHAPFATVSQIDSALARTARPVAGVRFGLLDAYAALQALGQPAPRFEPTIEGAADVGETLTAHTGIWAGARIELRVRLATLPRRELRNGRHGKCVPRPFGRPWHRVAAQCFRPRRADGGLRTDRGRARARATRGVRRSPAVRSSVRHCEPVADRGRARRSRSRRPGSVVACRPAAAASRSRTGGAIAPGRRTADAGFASPSRRRTCSDP